MKKIIFLVFVLKSFLFADYNFPVVGHNYDWGTIIQSACPDDLENAYNTANYDNIYDDVECYDRPDSTYRWMFYTVTRSYECSSNVDGSYLVHLSDQTSGDCVYSCQLTDSICQDRLGNTSAFVDDGCICAVPSPPLDDLDDDNDGIPNKCDSDYVDFLTMDCDGDGTNNSTDTDIDGDGLLNGNDPNPYVNGSDSGTSDTPCPASSYTFYDYIPEGQCSMDNTMFNAPDYSIKYVSNVYWDSCRQKCGVKFVYCPENQTIVSGQCRSPEPNEDDCIGTKDCYISGNSGSAGTTCTRRCHCLTVQFPTRVSENLYFEVGVACSDNYSNDDTLDNLRDTSDVNKTLPTDLLKDSNASANLDISASMKVALDSYAGAKEETQKELLTESKIQSLQLVNANTNLKTLNNTLENFSAVSTSNDGAINSTLKGVKDGIDTGNGLLGSIDGKMTTNNSLLGDIKDLLGDLNTSGDGDSNVTIGGSSFGDEYTDSDDESAAKGSISGTLDSVYDGLAQFAADNTNMINKIQDGFSSEGAQMSTGAEPIFCASVFGRQICINLCDSFGVFSVVLYYIFYVVFMFASLKLYFSAFKMR